MSVAGFATETTATQHVRDTSLFKKNDWEREKEPSSSSSLFLAVLDSLHWSRYFHLALVFKAVHGYLVFCSGNKAGNLSFRGAKAVRQQPASSPESSPRREEDRWKGTCRESLNVWRGELQSFRGDIHRYRRWTPLCRCNSRRIICTETKNDLTWCVIKKLMVSLASLVSILMTSEKSYKSYLCQKFIK